MSSSYNRVSCRAGQWLLTVLQQFFKALEAPIAPPAAVLESQVADDDDDAQETLENGYDGSGK